MLLGTQWLIDHEVPRRHISRLINLQRLALCRDGYKSLPSNDHESYYKFLVVADEDVVLERWDLDRRIGLFEAARIRDQQRAEAMREQAPGERMRRVDQLDEEIATDDHDGDEEEHWQEPYWRLSHGKQPSLYSFYACYIREC